MAEKEYNRAMLIAALTGNFGMGKSSVLSVFRGLGAVTLDSDRIVEILLKEEKVIEKIKRLLGSGVVSPDGGLDKKAVANRIFNDPVLKKGLEEIVHPLVFERVDDFISRIKDRDRVVIVEVPLLFEGDYQGRYKKTITVYTAEETAIERLEISGISRQESISRLKAQLPIDQKKSRADYLIDNSGTKDETRRQVEKIYRALMEEMK